MRTTLTRVAGVVAGLALVAAPLATAVPAQAAPAGHGTLTVTIVDDQGKPVNGMVTLIRPDGSTETPFVPTGDTLQSTYTADVPVGDYAVMIVGGWGLFGCVGVTPCLPLGGAPTYTSAAISLAEQEVETFTFTTKTPTLDTEAKTVGSELSVVPPPFLGSEEIGDLLDSLDGFLGGVLDPKVTWLRDGKRIRGAKGADYELTGADVGKAVTAQVKFPPIMSLIMSGLGMSGMAGLTPAPITLGPVVAEKIPTTTQVQIAGRPRVGERPTAFIDVSGDVAELNGWVHVKVAGLAPVRARVVDGHTQVRLPELNRSGARTILATFLGSGELASSTDQAQFRVRGERRR